MELIHSIWLMTLIKSLDDIDQSVIEAMRVLQPGSADAEKYVKDHPKANNGVILITKKNKSAN